MSFTKVFPGCLFIPTAASSRLTFYKAGERKTAFISNFIAELKVTSSLPPPCSVHMLNCNGLFLTSAFLVKASKGHLLFICLSSGHFPMPGYSVKSLMNKGISSLFISTTTGRYKW